MNIRAQDLVLDVGSGHNPHPRSDVLCDRYVDDDTERGGALQVDRPLIVADAHQLPFQDKAFGYVIASHILEHMDDPARFCSELTRVSARGYIASPTEIAEHLFFWHFHKWYVNKVDSTLILHPKPADTPNPFGEIWDYMYRDNRFFRRFWRSRRELFWAEVEWAGTIALEIQDRSPLDLDDPRLLEEMVRPREGLRTTMTRSGITLAEDVLPASAKRLVTRLRRQKRTPRRAVDLQAILACPACHGPVTLRPESVTCESCGRVYPVVNGLPRMLVDEALRSHPHPAAIV